MTVALGLFGLFIVGLVFYGMVLISRDATTNVHSVGHGPDKSNLSPLERATGPARDPGPATATVPD